MDLKTQMEDIYRHTPAVKIPWNIDTPPALLQQVVESGQIPPCKSIEMGCGIGNYVVYLAQNGFDATGVDFSPAAIEAAKSLALQKKVACHFLVADILGAMEAIQESFDFIYDWEVLHHIFPEDRDTYIQNVYRLLNHGQHYLSVCFSDRSPGFGGQGKYRRTPLGTTLYCSSETEIRDLVEPLFDIIDLATVEIAGKYSPHLAVYALLRKKDTV